MRRSKPRSNLSTNLSTQSWQGEFELYEEEGAEESYLGSENDQSSQLCGNNLSLNEHLDPKANTTTQSNKNGDSESFAGQIAGRPS